MIINHILKEILLEIRHSYVSLKLLYIRNVAIQVHERLV